MDVLLELELLLRERRRVIADHDWRDRDADGHLTALRDVSEKLSVLTASLDGSSPARLRHFLDNCSYDKALMFLTGETAPSGACGQ